MVGAQGDYPGTCYYLLIVLKLKRPTQIVSSPVVAVSLYLLVSDTSFLTNLLTLLTAAGRSTPRQSINQLV